MFGYFEDLGDNPLTNNTNSIRKLQGWIKHSFVWSVYFLLKADFMLKKGDNDIYYKIMREVIREGGDTDTNGCIVGGMIGAFLGVKALPANMMENVLSFDCSDNGILRPWFLNTKHQLVPNLEKIIDNRP